MDVSRKALQWAEYLLAQYREGGVLLDAHLGRFDPMKGDTFCDALDEMEYPHGSAVDPNALRQFVSRIWILPLFLRNQFVQVARNGQDAVRYRAFISEVTRAVNRILSDSGQHIGHNDGSEGGRNMRFDLNWKRGVRRADFIQVATAVFDLRLRELSFSRTMASSTKIRYESDRTFVIVRFRRHADLPSVLIGVSNGQRDTIFDLGELLRLLLGRHEADRTFVEMIGRRRGMHDYLAALADMTTVNCIDFLRGSADTLNKVRGLHAQRNEELADRVISYSEVVF